ncbi:MAG: hypothetical protein M3Z13_02250, partial [Candidatus Dormibacteraeota bacterium]|nr:hypothetical protein [Candidatus Dormibacteraeota bacterium]
MRRGGLVLLALGLAAAAYSWAALQTPPGFFEGFCPPIDYRFASPPPGVPASHQPASGHGEVKVAGGVVNPGYVATFDPDPQAQLSFVPGAFAPPTDGSGRVTIDLKPVREFPKPVGLTLVTNVYQVIASSPLVKNANLRLLYSTVLPAPSAIYVSRDGGPWQAVPSNASTGASGCTDIVAQVSSTGLYAAGFASASTASGPGGGQRIGGGQT